MRPVVYSWIDETERKKLAADFLMQSLPDGQFKPSISSNGMNLEIGVVVPDFFFNNGHLIEASQNRLKGKIGASHHKVTAFTEAVHEIKMGHDYNETVHYQTFRLPFKVERELCFDDVTNGWELQVFKHDDPDLAALHQCYFVLSIDMVSVGKPCMVAKLVSPNKVLAIINAPKKPTVENLDPYYPSKTKPTHTNKMAPSGDSYNMTLMFNGSNPRYTRPTHQVVSGDDNSEFEEHEDPMHN